MKHPTIALALLSFLLWAAPAQAQWSPDTTLVLKGRVVSMDKRIKDGQVVVRGGKVVAILRADADPPAGALVIDTEGYIYPGLINLHSHAKHNFLRLYDVPKVTTNSHQWNGGKSYSKHVNNPVRVITDHKLLNLKDEALKYAEVKSIVGGETALQGCSEVPSIGTTLVRNVEMENFGADHVDARTQTMDRLLWMELKWKRDELKKQTAWINHVAEGIDEHAHRQWSFPGFDPDKKFSTAKSKFNVPGLIEADLVFPGLVAVHATALTEEDFKQWRKVAGSRPKLVWSPTSNLLLYGKTTDIGAARKAGTIVALGTDWSPSGTKNLLWELKAAYEVNRAQSPRWFRTTRQLIETVTTNPAKILGWGDKVGRVRVGFYADLLVTDKVSRYGYTNLIRVREENVKLVLVGGNPLYGDASLMGKLKDPAQLERVSGSSDARPKVIDMGQDPSVPKGDLSLAEVEKRLLEGLKFKGEDLAKTVNGGIPDKDDPTKTSYEPREVIKAWLVKDLTKRNRPVPDELKDLSADLSAAHAKLYLERKFPHLEPIDALDTIYTDARFFADVERNIQWKAGNGIDLRKFAPKPVQNAQGAAGVLQGPNQD